MPVAITARMLTQLSRFLVVALFAINVSFANADEKTCVYISSYHQGFDWSDRVEAGLRASLAGHCRIVQFDMDTKRHKKPEDIISAATKALELIEREQPDVVVTSDDNAARYLIVPHLLGTELPVVFCGINWTVEEYSFPAENVTGIVEIAPLIPLIEAATQSVPDAKRVAYFSDQTRTESKNFERYSRAATSAGLEIDQLQVTTLNDWLDAFDKAQQYDFAIMGGIAAINDWDPLVALSHVRKNTSGLVVTTHEWQMPFSALGVTMIPEEQGEWAGTTAVAILNGTSVATIPIVTNRKWDTWVNRPLLEASGARVASTFLRSAKQFEE